MWSQIATLLAGGQLVLIIAAKAGLLPALVTLSL